MSAEAAFANGLESEVLAQLHSQRVAYLLGAGSSYLDGTGYPLASALWARVKGSVDAISREAIQNVLDNGATGLEEALDALDDGGARDTPYRHAVTAAIADAFRSIRPSLDYHCRFLTRLANRSDQFVQVFSLNYDPLVERAADHACVRLTDGFRGIETGYFDPSLFEECPWIGRASRRGTTPARGKRPVNLLKLHGSLGWHEVNGGGIRRRGFAEGLPDGARLLMVPPQRRKATDTMLPPYSALWTRFRASLAHDVARVNRLACIGYGFADNHVNEAIAAASTRSDFTLLVLTKALTDEAWQRWSAATNTIVVTEQRCSWFGQAGPGHPDLWSFERIAKEA